MNKLTVFLLLVVVALVCYLFTLYNIFGIRDLTTGIISAITTQVPSSPWALITGIGSALASVGTIAWKTVSSVKSKAEKTISQVKWEANNKVSDANNQTSGLIDENKDLKKHLGEAEQTLEAKTQESKGFADKVTSLEEQLRKKDITIDTLHETLRRNKLSDDERIEKIVVK